MSFFISDIDTAKIYMSTFFRPFAQCRQFHLSVDDMNKTLSGRRVVAYESLLKNKGKVQLGNPKSGRGGLRFSLQSLSHSSNGVSKKGGRNLSWSLTRLRVVPHFSSRIVERAKRERA